MLANDFKQIKFANFVKLQRGFDLPKNDRIGGNYPVVASTTIQDYHISYKVRPPGVVTGRSGSLGKVQYIDKPYWPLNTTLWVKDFKGNHPKFVYFYLSTMGLENFNSGAGVPTLNRNHLDGLDIKIPSIQLQRKIASILSAYDDLIENNLRRISILEEMARNLYREWFVKFRFPGHENVRFVDSELGRIPEGWDTSTITAASINVSYGLTSRAVNENVGPRFLRITDIVSPILRWESVPYCFASDQEINRNKLDIGDIVVARTGATVGYAKLITSLESETVYASYLVRFKFPSIELSYMVGIYMESNEYKQFVKSNAGGSAQPNANAKILGSAMVLIPPPKILNDFSDIVEKSISLRDNLTKLNSRLRNSRDLLLPKLISGEVDVSEMDIQFKDEVPA